MTQEKDKLNIWSFIGKIGALVALVWGILQIYTYISKVEDYEAETTGSHNYYQTPPSIINSYKKNVNYRAIVRTVIDLKGELKDYHLDTLINSHKKNQLFEYYQYKYKDNDLNREDYNEIWTFKIVNKGTKPLEAIALELPFGGSYKASFPDNKTIDGKFTNRIELGELRPSYEINVYCWRANDYFYPEQDESKSRFTHKNGWFSISYPIEINGIYAWAKNYSEFVIIGFVVLLFIVLGFGITIGEKSKKNDEERNIESQTN